MFAASDLTTTLVGPGSAHFQTSAPSPENSPPQDSRAFPPSEIRRCLGTFGLHESDANHCASTTLRDLGATSTHGVCICIHFLVFFTPQVPP